MLSTVFSRCHGLRKFALLAAAGALLAAGNAHAANPVLSISGDSAGNLALRLTYSDAPAYQRVYLDTDRQAASGFPGAGVGAEFLLENGWLYRYTGVNGSWSWAQIKAVPFARTAGVANWTLAPADIGTPSALDSGGQVQSPLLNSAMVSFSLAQPAPVPSTSPTGAMQDVSYAGSDAVFANPERGFYRHPGNCDSDAFDVGSLQSARVNEGVSLVMCVFYLKNAVYAPIAQSTLDFFQRQMNTVRAAGVKAVVRFAYSDQVPALDAAPAQALAHIDQLAPYLSANADVIAVLQAGFIGAWGEWYYTPNYGNQGKITDADWANRKALVDRLLAALPADRMVQLRTPLFKRTMYGGAALSAAEAYTGSARARLGHHNDCFLASNLDQGTYTDSAVEYPYLEAETLFLPIGGETCEVFRQRSDCAPALQEMARLHWSYLNADYHPKVISRWSSGGCLPRIKQQLGYRLALVAGSFATGAKPGGALPISFTIRNSGWAAPFNPRPVELVMRHTVTGVQYRFTLTADPRAWKGGTSTTVSQTLTLPANMASGHYTLLLNLPDPAASLYARPEYAVRLANANLWEPASGLNQLLHTVAVAP